MRYFASATFATKCKNHQYCGKQKNYYKDLKLCSLHTSNVPKVCIMTNSQMYHGMSLVTLPTCPCHIGSHKICMPSSRFSGFARSKMVAPHLMSQEDAIGTS